MRFRDSLLAALAVAAPLLAQVEDPGKKLNELLAERTGKKFQLSFEARQRAEDRTGQVFGRERDLAADYLRFRFGATYRPVSWIKLSALAQDTRAPFYGLPAPGNVRDPLDLQEGYIEMFSQKQTGWGFSLGRQMVSYGDSRLIGSPQWAYTARTWDTARLFHVTKKAKFEILGVSTIAPSGTGFNKPRLGDRIWGTYNVFRDVFGRNTVDAYILRHDINATAGFVGPGRHGVNLFGTRWAIPLRHGFRFSTEGVVQNGKVGLLPHRAYGWVGQPGYKTAWRKMPLDLFTEYKYASGTDPTSGRSGTFDQLYPAAHDKLGHVDLMGWRNVHNVKSQATLNVRKQWAWILMYNNTWLADARDALYSAQGRAIARAPRGDAGRHAGQEVDLFFNYAWSGVAIAAGVGQFFPGEFVRRTTPGAHSRLLYLSTGYSF